MATKTKSKTYGRRKVNDLTACFNVLSLGSPEKGGDEAALEDAGGTNVLKSISGNAKLARPSTRDDRDKTEGERPGRRKLEVEDSEASSLLDICCHPPKQASPSASARALLRDRLWSSLEHLLELPYVQPNILDFSSQSAIWHDSFNIQKIAHGSYASIFRFALKTNDDLYTIWKLMPLKPAHGKGSRDAEATCIEDAIAEVKLLESMSKSPGFVEFRSASVLQGSLPVDLIKAGHEWRSRLTETEREELGGLGEKHYDDSQIWLIIEMSDAGTDLESLLKQRASRKIGTRLEIDEVWDVFWGCVEALAHGEEHAKYEHRDLHPGNVCIRQREERSSLSESSTSGREHLVPRLTKWDITLIDYTLSRASLNSKDSETGEVLANKMEASIFNQHSSHERDEMQYDTYRHMRSLMHQQHKAVDRKTGWKTFMPRTNILWLHFILTVLLEETNADSRGSAETTLDLAATRLLQVQNEIRPETMGTWTHCNASDLLRSQILQDGS